MKIGFIGLGNVGGKLAGSLLRNKFDLTVRDLDEKLTKLAREYCGLNEAEKNIAESLSADEVEEKTGGTFGGKRLQAKVRRKDYPSELVLGRGPDNNAFIIIRDFNFIKSTP